MLFILSFWYFSWLLFITLSLSFIGITLFDLVFSPSKKDFTFDRDMPEEMERFEEYTVSIDINNASKKPAFFHLKDGLPVSFNPSFNSLYQVKGETKSSLEYTIKPMTRGDFVLSQLFVRFKSKLGLWEKQLTPRLESNVKIIPNLSEAKKYLSNAQMYLVHEGNKIRKQRSGMGEFSKVRTYVVGDDPRKINWRQSAKLHEMMTNVYEPEHGKYITLFIDCGRMMGVELENANRLEKAIEAAITVAAAALDNGDYVSVIAFSKEIKTVVPARKGLPHLDRILKGLYNLKADPYESNYAYALQYGQQMQRKRSMFLLFSDVQTFILEDSLQLMMKKIRKKHLVLMLGIEDSLQQKKIKASPSHVGIAIEKSLAQKQDLYLRDQIHYWHKHGISLIEAKAERLAVTAVSQYIDQLNRGSL